MSSASSARSTAQVPQTTGDTQYNVRDAALRGASSAFSKPPVKAKPQVNTYTGGNNGALLAATKVGAGTSRSAAASGNTSPLRKDWTGGSARSVGRPNASPQHPLSNSSSSSALRVPDDSFLDRTPSPSNIAAKLAAARHSPMRPLPQRVMSEKDANEGDILPPPGSVGNLLAKLDSKKPSFPPPKRRRSIGSASVASTARLSDDIKPTDDTPIAPTTSLVKMFEQNRPTTPTQPAVSLVMVPHKAPPPVRSPKPQRKFNLPPEPEVGEPLERRKTHTPPPIKPKPKSIVDLPNSTDGVGDSSSFGMLREDSLGTPPARHKPAQLTAIRTNSRPRPPVKRGTRQTRPQSEDFTRSSSVHRRLSSSLGTEDMPSSPSSFVSAREEQEDEKPQKPTLPPPRRSTRPKSEAPPEIRPRTATPLPPKPRAPSKVTSPLPAPEKFPLPRRRSASAVASPGGTLYHSNYQRESVKAIAKHMTGESLSNAIVGAALASSRNASPAPSANTAPPLPTRKHHQHHSPLHRSPSPTKPAPKPSGKLRTTMRKDKSSSSDEDESEKYKRKGTRIMGMGRKHPNKHHEGTRKRWRDQVTERERKRYEGVWAANKGLHITIHQPPRSIDEDPTFDVLNIVTKEIWTRSRLPETVLEEVWDLVDARGVGRLRREEFVVGMWLIDQRLKGRKLPIRVSESVWGSVRGAGVKIKVGHHK